MAFKSLLTLASFVAAATAAAVDKRAACPDGSTAKNAACCAFFALKTDLLTNLFDEGCSEETHETLRLAFHDAIAISPAVTKTGKFGGTGADGSMILFPNNEPSFKNNAGIIDSVNFLSPFLKAHNVSAGDLIQFAAGVAMSQCPGAPQLTFMAGRANAKQPAPDGLIPAPEDSVTSILARFADAGAFTSDEVVALLASHSVARSDHIDPGLTAVPFDSTPFTFDTQFFVEVQLRGTGFVHSGGANTGEVASPLTQSSGDQVGEMRLASDHNFARDSRTACTFQSFVNNQSLMQSKFKAAMLKLSILGSNKANLIDCTEALPPQAKAVTKAATFPAGKSNADIEQACATTPFPTLKTDPGQPTLIPHCDDGTDTCGDS